MHAPFTADIITILRSLDTWRKLELARDLNRMADTLALAGLRLRQPTATDGDLAYALALQRLPTEQRMYGKHCLEGRQLMPTPVDPLFVAVRVGALLDRLGISYVIVGSVAAVVHGEYRMTRDLDVVLQITSKSIKALVEGLREAFTFLPSDITDALNAIPEARQNWRKRASFCAYDKETGFQLDVYLSSGRTFERAQFQRAITVPIPGEGGGFLQVASAEDTILAKLEWYAMSPSDRQWRDVQAIISVQGDRLDRTYLQVWARTLNISELLDKALNGQSPTSDHAPEEDNPLQQRMF